MRLIIDDVLNDELVEYLSKQDGIENVKKEKDGYYTVLIMDINDKIYPELIYKHVALFNDYKLSMLIAFDKETEGKYKTLNYRVDDICCEYCYRAFVESCYNNEHIKSVKSDADFSKSVFEVNFIIEYDEVYCEDKLIDFLDKHK
ncbi:MAG: hypothetical protein IKP76_01505 [Bacilli bacterium]|nr:hypothetical protein [Bacilli bacterium]